MSEITDEHIEWSRRMFQCLVEGGLWAVPRSGIILQRCGEKFVLVGQLREQDRRRLSDKQKFYVKNTLKVDNTGILSSDQRLYFQNLGTVFAKAGIVFEDDTGEFPYMQSEHGTFTYGITKKVGKRVVTKQLGVTFNPDQALRELVEYGFDISNMHLVTGVRPGQPPRGFA